MISLCRKTMILAPAERCFDLARSIDSHAVSASLIHGQSIAGRTAELPTLGD